MKKAAKPGLGLGIDRLDSNSNSFDKLLPCGQDFLKQRVFAPAAIHHIEILV